MATHPQTISRGAGGKTLPDRIVEHFLARIFTGELAPGTRLAPDRELAPSLGVDRTSLRIAMQQLSRFGVVKAVQGSGVRVLDYREHAGFDFLAAVFALSEVSLGSSFLLQALDDWIDLMPVVTARAVARATHRDLADLDAILGEQLTAVDAGKPEAELAAHEIRLQDRVMAMLGNTTLTLIGNSSRPLRLRIVTLYFEATDVRAHVLLQRASLQQAMGHSRLPPEQLVAMHRAFLTERTAPLRKRIEALPVNPSLVTAATATKERAAARPPPPRPPTKKK